MSSVYQTVISIISKPIEERDDNEINSIVVWFTNLFRKKSTVFGDVSQEVIRDIIKNCNFETKNRDDIIIRQGDKGDCFYINLRGKVSIYINHKQHDVFDDETNEVNTSISSDDTSARIESANESNTKSIRDRLGNYVTSLNAGEGFGEIALVSDEDRTASIIADETTDLMVVNKALYRRCLQAPALRKLAEKQNFINQSPFFGNWSQKMKKLLSLCLEREIIRYDSYLGKQGEPLDKIYFIIKGQAKVTVDPTLHMTQYPRFYPLKLPENEGQEIISTWIEEKNRNQGVANKPDAQNSLRRNSQAIVRRTFTFAEAEQRRKIKNIEVGILGPGEISGLCEVIMDMPTYKQSTKCMEDCEVFYIYKRSYDRLIAKRNPTCVNKMREYVYFKLQARNRRLKLTNSIAFYRSLEYRLHILIHGRKKSVNAGLYSSTPNANSSATVPAGLKLPPRGPIIQMDSRPKPKLKSRKAIFNLASTQQQLLMLNKEKGVDSTDDSLNSSRSSDTNNNSSIESAQQPPSQVQQQTPTYVEQTTIEKIDKKKNFERVFDLEYSTDQALNELEGRIKQWHLQNGCKKPLLEAFHRVDVEKLKYSVKSGGKITLKPKLTNMVRLTRQKRGSGSSGFSSGSGDNNDSDDENNHLDIGNEYLKLNHAPRFFTNNQSLTVTEVFNNHNNHISYTNDDGYYEHEEDDHHQQQQHYHHQRHSLQTTTTSNTNYSAASPTTVVNYERIRRNTLHFESIVNNETLSEQEAQYKNSNRKYSKRRSLPSKLLINDNNLQEIFNNSENNDSNIVINKKLSSAVNLNHRFSIFNSQYTPYLFRKLSMSQVKIHSSNRKKYSKEEYLLLKDELKRQTRRYSVTSAHL